ncbi:MAG: MBL fold metallo-hydrolase [Actinomycetales bacterium]|nr:MBL fold metallo-hydrolase [Actinomycetales bacterium]
MDSFVRIGGPTVAFTYAGLRFLTDPTFDPPGPRGRLVKTVGPALASEALGPVDVVLLSHDQHADNLDEAGREVALAAPLVLTTPEAAERLGPPALGLADWARHRVDRPDGSGAVVVTAVPAVHGPDGAGQRAVTRRLAGPVTGFHLAADGEPTVYVSGDNASLRVVGEIADRLGPVDHAVLFGGAARSSLLPANLTLDAAAMVRAVRLLGSPTVAPVHVDSWAHFTEGIDDVRAAFEAAGLSGLLR